MFGDEKKLKDTNLPPPNLPLRRGRSDEGVLSYRKTDKLITALYMVTDIIDKDEPLRNKLRTLGVEILSGIISAPRTNLDKKIREVMSFLDIASAMNIVSEMNCNILRKEFLELDQSLKESTNKTSILNKRINLAEFLFDSPRLDEEGAGGGNSEITTSPFGHSSSTSRRDISKGHARIGVQKGSTLMKALSGVKMSDRKFASPLSGAINSFDILKKQRRDDIVNIIKILGGNATIKDIKDTARTNPGKTGSLASCGEKTLQRELVSMVKDGVLKKTGEKRWSRYFIN